MGRPHKPDIFRIGEEEGEGQAGQGQVDQGKGRDIGITQMHGGKNQGVGQDC